MKKMTFLFCMGAVVFTLAACGNKAEEGSGESTSVENSSAENTLENESTDESSSPADESVTGSASEDAGFDPSQGWSEEMESLKAAVTAAVGEGDYWPDMAADPEILEMFYGLSTDMYEDYLAESPMISANVDALVIVRAKEDTADEVEALLNAYRDANVNDTMQYPQNLEKIQASRVERIGNYVIFVQLGGSVIDSDNREEVLTLCQEANEKAIEAIREILEGSTENQDS